MQYYIALTELLCTSELLRCVFVYFSSYLSCFCFKSKKRKVMASFLSFCLSRTHRASHGLSDPQATGCFAEHNMPMFIFKLKIYLFVAVLGLHCCMGYSLVVESGASL